MSTTPNMNLLLPDPTITPGPTYASENNDAFEVIDDHDHTTGKGLPVPSNGLNINNDLPFNAFNATNLRSSQYFNNSSPLSLPGDITAVYVSGGDLWYNNQIGQQVQITSGAALNAGSIGGIGGDYVGSGALEFYTSADKTFTFWSSTNVPANLDAGSLIIRNILLNSFGITLQPNGTIPANYSIQLPANNNTGNTVLLSYDTANNIGFVGPGALDADTYITPQTVTQGLLALKTSSPTATVGNIAESSPIGVFTTTGTSTVVVTGLTVTITTAGRPVRVAIQSSPNVTASVSVVDGTSTMYIIDSTTGSQFLQANIGNSTATTTSYYPVETFQGLDMSTNGLPGTYTYVVEITGGNTGSVVTIENCLLIAYEI